MLIHDDIIDKSETRRGKPSMHVVLRKYISGHPDAKFNGEDLALVLGDILYSFSIHSFLAVQENLAHKEAALKKLMEAAFYTGGGEFIELILGLKSFEKIQRADIDKIYDYKTAIYTFAAPLTIGATLAGAPKTEIQKLFSCGLELGRAFQIKDDVIGLFGEESEIGKPNLTDIQEGKKTLLIWHAYHHTDSQGKSLIKKIFAKENAGVEDLTAIRKIVRDSGALWFAEKEIKQSLGETLALINSSAMKAPYKNSLKKFSEKLLAV